jgi:hypothetical protein
MMLSTYSIHQLEQLASCTLRATLGAGQRACFGAWKEASILLMCAGLGVLHNATDLD